MSFRDRAVLTTYRLRPLEPVMLGAGLIVAVVAGVLIVPSKSPGVVTVGDATRPLAMIAFALALMTGFVAGRDVDSAEDLLRSAPVPYRRALTTRLALWAPVAAVVAAGLGARAAGALDAPAGALQAQTLVHLLFAGAVTTVAARSLGPLAGGGAALAAMLVTAGAPFAYEGFPLLLLAEPGTPDWQTTSPRLIAIGAALLALSWWKARP